MMQSVEQPLISVLLPVKNGRATLGLALRSILAQGSTSLEVLVLDDGSTDGSPDLVRAISDERLRLIVDGQHKGLAARLNQGIDMSRGRYIARMDADDVAFPARLQRQLDYLVAHPEIDLLGTRAIVFRSPMEVIGLLPFRATHEEICARPWRGLPLPHPTWMGKASWFRTHRYRAPEVLRAEDQELLLRAAPTSRYACLDEVLLGYRQDSFSLRKVWLARVQLLRAQAGLFYRRHQWRNLGLAILAGALKVAVDVLAAMPGSSRLFFARMAGAHDERAEQALKSVLAARD
ncbi:glycosyltransferase family A protein [Herbaspirillum sp. YR522]|uniref:glycosyltransferase family 2 protein n=1 Tax=Herbaspirillum sp. YR522 TaxID=1144342 RepID=UPI00026F9143|nr:glycosyltransferase family A protein [Herbaspirillum sp. YR522]EJN00858.1 glycosyl transferase [Herbaspirillum sp. YR522]